MRDEHDYKLPAWVAPMLREPVQARDDARERIMERIRSGRAPRTISAPIRATRWLRRGLLTPAGAMTTMLACMMLISFRLADRSAMTGIETMARIVGDSIIPSRSTPVHAGIHSAIFDTLRIVEFVIRGPQVRAASVVGDFNRWRRDASPMTSIGHGVWRARLLVPTDALRFAFLVNGDRVVPVSAAD